MSLAYKTSSAINSQYGQATAVVWRIYGTISRIYYTSVLIVLFHIKYLEKIRTLNITTRKLND
jgi:hypothetical protein